MAHVDLEQQLKKLGLNKKQAEAYLYILKNKKVNLKTLSDKFHITTAGVSKLLKDMTERGFIKSFELGNKKIFMATDIREFRDEFLKKKKEEIADYEKLFEDLKAGYGGYSIKFERLSHEAAIKKYVELVKKANSLFEFQDMRNMVKPHTEISDEMKALKIDIKYLFVPAYQGHIFEGGIEMKADEDKNYAQVFSTGTKVSFQTTNKEVVMIDNVEIANSIQLLVSTIHEKK